MSTTSDRLGAQAKTVSNDLKEMGDIVTDAAQEKLAASARECHRISMNRGETMSTAYYATSSNTCGSGRSSLY